MRKLAFVLVMLAVECPASEAKLLSGFYDPTAEDAWTFQSTGNVNGGEPIDGASACTNKAYGLITNTNADWVVKVRIVSAADRTLCFGAAAKDLFKNLVGTGPVLSAPSCRQTGLKKSLGFL